MNKETDKKNIFSLRKVVILGVSIFIVLLISAEILMSTFSHGWRDRVLYLACAEGNTQKAEFFIKYLFTDVNKSYNTGLAPIHAAVASGNLATIKLLLDQGANVNAPGVCGITPLHDACHFDGERLDIVELLIKRGADVNMKGRSVTTPLHWAASGNKIKTMELLIANGADVNAQNKYKSTPLSNACAGDKFDAVELLIKHGAKVNVVDKFKATPMHYAAKKSPKMLNLIINNGANIHGTDENKTQPIHWVSNAENAKILIQHGAKLNAEDEYGYLPIHYAAKEGHPDIIKVLIANGAKVDVFNKNNYGFVDSSIKLTPLLLACAYEKDQAAKALVKAGADVNLTIDGQWTPLHYAYSDGNTDLIQFLLDNGADKTIKDKDGKAPPDITPRPPLKFY